MSPRQWLVTLGVLIAAPLLALVALGLAVADRVYLAPPGRAQAHARKARSPS